MYFSRTSRDGRAFFPACLTFTPLPVSQKYWQVSRRLLPLSKKCTGQLCRTVINQSINHHHHTRIYNASITIIDVLQCHPYRHQYIFILFHQTLVAKENTDTHRYTVNIQIYKYTNTNTRIPTQKVKLNSEFKSFSEKDNCQHWSPSGVGSGIWAGVHEGTLAKLDVDREKSDDDEDRRPRRGRPRSRPDSRRWWDSPDTSRRRLNWTRQRTSSQCNVTCSRVPNSKIRRAAAFCTRCIGAIMVASGRPASTQLQ